MATVNRRDRRKVRQARTTLCNKGGCYNAGLIRFAVTRYDSDSHIHHDRDVMLCPDHAGPALEVLGSPTRPCPMA
jgi:hypothetical protein